MNLLEKAKAFKPAKKNDRVFTQEELEVFIAFAKEEITLNQARNALNYEHSGTIYVNISKAFVQLYQRGIIEFKPFKKGKTLLCHKCKKEMIVFDDVDEKHRDFCSTECYNQFQIDKKNALWAFFNLLKK
jgi:hypothetical protein